MIKILFGCLLSLSLSFHVKAQYTNTPEGKVVEKNTQQPIPYATIKSLTSGESVISNTEGIFVLRQKLKTTDTILISAMGFVPLKITVGNLLSNTHGLIELAENITSLSTITITPVKIEKLLQQAVKTSNDSYLSPAVITGYYKEYVKRDSVLTKYADGIISYHIKREKDGLPNITLQVVQSRVKELEIPKEEDKINQLNTPINIKGLGEFATPAKTSVLDSNNFKYYNYQLSQLTENERQIYCVSFKPINGDKKSLFTGKIYIDKETMLIIGLDYSVAPISSAYLSDISFLGIHISYTARVLSLRYKIKAGQYTLAYVGQRFGLKISSKHVNQHNTFKSEFWASDIKTEIVSTPKDKFYTKKALYKRGNNYQTAFWTDFSFTENTSEEVTFLK